MQKLGRILQKGPHGAAGGHKIMAAIKLQNQRDILIFPLVEAYNREQLKKSAELWPLPRLW